MVDTKLTIGIIITLALAISGTYYVAQDDDAFYCQDKDIVMICEKLSGLNSIGLQTRCYYEETYKVCNTGWEEIEISQVLEKEEIQEGKRFECNQFECILLE